MLDTFETLTRAKRKRNESANETSTLPLGTF